MEPDSAERARARNPPPSLPRQSPYSSIANRQISHCPAGEGAQGGVDEPHVVDHDPVQGGLPPDEGHVPEAARARNGM